MYVCACMCKYIVYVCKDVFVSYKMIHCEKISLQSNFLQKNYKRRIILEMFDDGITKTLNVYLNFSRV